MSVVSVKVQCDIHGKAGLNICPKRHPVLLRNIFYNIRGRYKYVVSDPPCETIGHRRGSFTLRLHRRRRAQQTHHLPLLNSVYGE